MRSKGRRKGQMKGNNKRGGKVIRGGISKVKESRDEEEV